MEGAGEYKKGGQAVKMHNILSGVSFVSGLVGVAGIAGAIECGTGYCTSTVLIIIALVSGICARAEAGGRYGIHVMGRSRTHSRHRRMERKTE